MSRSGLVQLVNRHRQIGALRDLRHARSDLRHARSDLCAKVGPGYDPIIGGRITL